MTFADITPRLRQTGVDVFLAQMRRQRDDIRALIKDSSTGREMALTFVNTLLKVTDAMVRLPVLLAHLINLLQGMLLQFPE